MRVWVHSCCEGRVRHEVGVVSVMRVVRLRLEVCGLARLFLEKHATDGDLLSNEETIGPYQLVLIMSCIFTLSPHLA